MPIKEMPRTFKITGRPGFEDMSFSPSSESHLSVPSAVKFAAQHGVLQSAREAAAFRIEANGADNSDRYQATRTVAVYGPDFVAFDDTPNPEANIILARAKEGYDFNSKIGTWQLPESDRHIKGILERAGKAGRIVTLPRASPNEFTDNEIVQAILGDMAEPYANQLEGQGYKNTYVYTLARDEGREKLAVRSVGLGDGNVVSYLDAIRFSGVGFARGVAGAGEFRPRKLVEKVEAARAA